MIVIAYYFAKLRIKLYYNFSKKINKDLDICVIIDTVKEINLIKELLLT